MPKISITSITDLNVFVKYLPISVDTTTKNSEYKTILAKPHTFMFNVCREQRKEIDWLERGSPAHKVLMDHIRSSNFKEQLKLGTVPACSVLHQKVN